MPPPRTEEAVCLGAECMSFQEVMQLLASELSIQDRTYHLLKYRSCFVGRELADFVQKRFALRSRAEAVQVCESLHGLRCSSTRVTKQYLALRDVGDILSCMRCLPGGSPMRAGQCCPAKRQLLCWVKFCCFQ